MTRLRRLRLVRRGFTLVELLVATALVILILTILAVAFGAATDSLSRMRSLGNMATDLRGAQEKLRADLEAQHFETGDSPGNLRLSDLRYHLLTPGGNQTAPPLDGYFRIEQGTGAASGSTYEGADADGMMSTRAVNNALEFTAKRLGTSPDDLYVVTSQTMSAGGFSATDTPLGPNQFASKWARVRWELRASVVSGGVQTFTLHRSVRLLVPDAAAATTFNTGAEAEVFSTGPIPNAAVPPNAGPFTPHTLRQISSPAVRATSPIAPYTPAANPNHYGDDIVLSNVISFEVKPTWDAPPTGTGPREPRSTIAGRHLPIANTAVGTTIPDGIPGVAPTLPAPTMVNTDAPFDDLPVVTENPNLLFAAVPPVAPNLPRVFDTWSGSLAGWNTPGTQNSLPLRIRVTALQVKIRVIDPKTLISRQVSFIVQP